MDESAKERRVFRLAPGVEPPRAHLRLVAPAPSSDFLSHLIAERQHLLPQPEGRREAVTAYDRGARIAVRRMPAGYRTTIIT